MTKQDKIELIISIITLIIGIVMLGIVIFDVRPHPDPVPQPITISVNVVLPDCHDHADILEIEEVEATVSENISVFTPDVIAITESEAIELTRIATAEAGNQSDYGIRLVIDTVLNRVEDPRFPNDVHSVIFQPNQYYTAGMNAVVFRHDILSMVYQEAEARTDTNVKFFARSWPRSGTRYLQEGDHYFNY